MKTKNKKILVTGGAGYVGSHVVKALRDSGHKPIVYDNLSTGLKENLLPGIPFILGDTLSTNQLKHCLNDVHSVIHMAAHKASGEPMTNPGKYAHNNLTGTIKLLNAAKEKKIK